VNAVLPLSSAVTQQRPRIANSKIAGGMTMLDPAEISRRLTKIWIDMYEGDGDKNVPMTLRVRSVEEDVAEIKRKSDRREWFYYVTTVGVVVELLLHILHIGH
jgi:hypothetical protein